MDYFSSKSTQAKVTISIQQRSGRKCITIVQGLADDLDIPKITKALKNSFKCSGSMKKDPDFGEIIQLSGDKRTDVRTFLISEEICSNDQIIVRGA